MADNDRFSIQKINEINVVSESCENCIGKGKTRAEWEEIIAEIIFNKFVNECPNKCGHYPIEYLSYIKTNQRELAKAVVDRLFGVGE